MSLDSPPTVSTGATDLTFGSMEVYHIEVRRSGTRGARVYRYDVGPWLPLGHDKQIRGIWREVGARAFERKGLTRCMIADAGWCSMKGRTDLTWRELIHMDFDHMNGDRTDHRFGNLQPACSSCNSHKQRKPSALPTTNERESEPRANTPTSGETALSWQIFPLTVEDAFHPMKGRVAKPGMSVNKEWYVNNLPDIIGRGRATTFGKYITEFIQQGYLDPQPSKDGIKLVRTDKSVEKLLWRELGIHDA